MNISGIQLHYFRFNPIPTPHGDISNSHFLLLLWINTDIEAVLRLVFDQGDQNVIIRQYCRLCTDSCKATRRTNSREELTLETGSSGGNTEEVPEFLKDCWVPGKEKQLW